MHSLELAEVVSDVADAVLALDASREPFKRFQAGAGPYGEPQLLKAIASHLNEISKYDSSVRTKRTPDLLIPGHWALEFKIARPFGDNGARAENWSVNVLHPYAGNESSIGDCLKLAGLAIPERRGVVVIGYEHDPPQVDLDPLIKAFEVISREVVGIELGDRREEAHSGLIHPVHQRLRVFAWEVISRQEHAH